MKLTVDGWGSFAYLHADGHRIGEFIRSHNGKWIFRPQLHGQWSMSPGQLAHAIEFGNDHAKLMNVTARLTA